MKICADQWCVVLYVSHRILINNMYAHQHIKAQDTSRSHSRPLGVRRSLSLLKCMASIIAAGSNVPLSVAAFKGKKDKWIKEYWVHVEYMKMLKDEVRECRFVFIGRNLDKNELIDGVMACKVTGELHQLITEGLSAEEQATEDEYTRYGMPGQGYQAKSERYRTMDGSPQHAPRGPNRKDRPNAPEGLYASPHPKPRFLERFS